MKTEKKQKHRLHVSNNVFWRIINSPHVSFNIPEQLKTKNRRSSVPLQTSVQIPPVL